MGGQVAYVARTPNARVLLEASEIDGVQLDVMEEIDLEYIVLDRTPLDRRQTWLVTSSLAKASAAP